ncbi:MAG: hypothetical protein HQ498_05390 [Pseudohongiella sp.]|nr:hypothetical protein [Pseudohongiella sp.]
MNWDAIGAVGEIAGAIAVVVSLIYLASQIRQSNRLMTLEATKYATEAVIPIADMVLADDSLIDLMIKDSEELTVRELVKLKLLGRRMIIGIRSNYLAKDDVRYLDESITMYNSIYHRDKFNYGMSLVWPDYRKELNPEFVAWFDENIVSQ